MTPDVVKYLHQLELAPSASWDEVQKSYRDLIRVWHPDRFAHDEHLRVRAEQKAKDLNEAIRYLRRHYRKTMLIRRDPFVDTDPKSGVYPGATHAFGGTHQSVKPERDTTSFDGQSSAFNPQMFSARRAEGSSVIKVAATNLIAFFGMCIGIAALSSIGMPDFHFASATSSLPASGTKSSYRAIDPHAVTVVSATAESAAQPDATDRFHNLSANTRPALVQAAMRCDVSAIKRAMEGRDMDVNVTDENGDTALAWTARLNCISGARILLDAGIDTRTVARNGFTPLSWAEWARNSQIAELIKQNGSAPTMVASLNRSRNGRTEISARPAAH